MEYCDELPVCRFFNEVMSSMPTTAEMMKRQYCHADFSRGARIVLAKAGGKVPADLAPNDLKRVQRLLPSDDVG